MDINFIENEDGTITWSPTLTKYTEITSGKRMTADEFNRLMLGTIKQSNHTAKSLAKLIETYNENIPSAKKLEQLATNKIEVEETNSNAEPTVTILKGDNGPYFKFSNLKGVKGDKGDQGPVGATGPRGPQGEQGPQGVGIPSNMSQNANKTIIVDGSVVNGNWNATFIVQQGGKQRPICAQHTNHTGGKAEMVATANSAKFKFVNGSTDPQSYMEVFEDKINFSKPITVQGNPVGGGGEYYICSPLVDGVDTYASNNCFILLPPESSCSKIELIDVVYLQQPRNSSPYTTRIPLNWVLYDKNGGATTTFAYIPYQQGDLDSSGNLHNSYVYFSYESYYGLFGGTPIPDDDGYESVRTSCFRFKITV